MFSRDIGIDLGTANTLVYVRGKGIVLREPSVVAISNESPNVIAVGEDAKKMIGRTPGNIKAVRPVRDGVIADFDATKIMLKALIKKGGTGNGFFKPRVVVCVPSGVTDVERRAVEEATQTAGAKEVYIVEEPKAAALGAGLPVNEAIGSMVVDVGGGTTEVAVLSLDGIVTSKSLRVGGNRFDDAIMNFTRKKFNLLIGERSAEDVKMTIGCALPGIKKEKMQIKGRDVVSGFPRTAEITSDDVAEALAAETKQIVDAIKSTLEKTPPELAADIFDRGVALTGGGAMLPGLDQIISNSVGVPVYTDENPMDCVVKGTGVIVDYFGKMKKGV